MFIGNNAGYAYYNISGAKKAVDASRTASAYYQQTKDAIAAKAPNSPNEALDQLRNFARSYLVIIPGARPHVDAAFDTIDELRESRRRRILQSNVDLMLRKLDRHLVARVQGVSVREIQRRERECRRVWFAC